MSELRFKWALPRWAYASGVLVDFFCPQIRDAHRTGFVLVKSTKGGNHAGSHTRRCLVENMKGDNLGGSRNRILCAQEH